MFKVVQKHCPYLIVIIVYMWLFFPPSLIQKLGQHCWLFPLKDNRPFFLTAATFRATRTQEPLTSSKIAHGVLFGAARHVASVAVGAYHFFQKFPCSSAGEGADRHVINNLCSVKQNTEKQLDVVRVMSFKCCTGTRDTLEVRSVTSAR